MRPGLSCRPAQHTCTAIVSHAFRRVQDGLGWRHRGLSAAAACGLQRGCARTVSPTKLQTGRCQAPSAWLTSAAPKLHGGQCLAIDQACTAVSNLVSTPDANAAADAENAHLCLRGLYQRLQALPCPDCPRVAEQWPSPQVGLVTALLRRLWCPSGEPSGLQPH